MLWEDAPPTIGETMTAALQRFCVCTPQGLFCYTKDMEAFTSFLRSIEVSYFTAYLGFFQNPRQLFILLGIVLLALYGISVGKTRILISVLAIFVGYTLTQLFPYRDFLNKFLPESSYGLSVGSFLLFSFLVFLALSHSSIRARLSHSELALWQLFIVSILQIGLLVAMVISFFPETTARQYLGIFYEFFGTAQVLFFWALASIIVIPFLKARR